MGEQRTGGGGVVVLDGEMITSLDSNKSYPPVMLNENET